MKLTWQAAATHTARMAHWLVALAACLALAGCHVSFMCLLLFASDRGRALQARMYATLW